MCVLSFDYIKGTPSFPSWYAFSLTKEVGYLYLYLIIYTYTIVFKLKSLSKTKATHLNYFSSEYNLFWNDGYESIDSLQCHKYYLLNMIYLFDK